MSNRKQRIAKTILVPLVFIGFWIGFHRFITGTGPPNVVDVIFVIFFGLVINIFVIYYAFIHKLSRNERVRLLNWRQLFVIAMTVLLIAYRVYFAFEEIERGFKDRSGIIWNCTRWIFGLIFIGGIWIFLLRDKRIPDQKIGTTSKNNK